ncbi:hypothetical protein B0H66DRAFT_559616, partial [Apodospora peruviana]
MFHKNAIKMVRCPSSNYNILTPDLSSHTVLCEAALSLSCKRQNSQAMAMEALFGNESTISESESWRPEPEHRRTFSILLTCVISLGLCVWTVLRMNVPAREERQRSQLPSPL